ncbi:MAG: competence/damage-inducible protein A [Desulfobacterales bacterium]|nr:competence/damage-inducible protein A [Desulfobacterales bacterium]
MKFEILATGNELTTGKIIDSNSAYIATKLQECGCEVSRLNCVGDDKDSIVSILKEISQRADISIVTGGLGPTTDDLTSDAAAIASEKNLLFHENVCEHIKDLFKKFGRTMPEANKKQAFFPEKSEILDNPVGTAPGFYLVISKCHFFFMPGVPSEMYKMFDEQVMPRIYKILGIQKDFTLSKNFSLFGMPESLISSKLEDFSKIFKSINVGMRAKFPDIEVTLYGKGSEKVQINNELDLASNELMNRLGNYVYSTNKESIEKIIGNLLLNTNATLSLAESCTGGLISHMITSVSGSSDYFLFSGVTYSNEAKVSVLGVSQNTLETHGAVSQETVTEMVRGVQNLTGSTYSIATSGIAGPTGGTETKPVGTLCVGLAYPNGLESFHLYLPIGDRIQKKEIFAFAALDILRRKILNMPYLKALMVAHTKVV